MTVNNYSDLVVWNRAMDLTVEIYRICKLLPREEMYVLGDQLRRAAISVPSNIAEGYARSTREYIRFLGYASGSVYEVETQIQIAARVGCVQSSDIEPTLALCAEVARMLNSMISKLSQANQ